MNIDVERVTNDKMLSQYIKDVRSADNTQNISGGIEKLNYSYDDLSVADDVKLILELKTEHHDFLMKRHGSVQLEPLPSLDLADPLNWSDWRKVYELILISFHCFIVTFMAAGIAPAYEAMSIQYEKT
ncbi:unnamed protein product [Debaryomyces tyrocola]|nr:unnamed protein product [Debaryomyces tyrocola]